MIGITRSRRLGALLAGAALVIAAGCTVGTTSIPAGQGLKLIECTAGRTRGPYWQAGPGATRLRFQVLSSDATQPLEALMLVGTPDPISFGTVWDGTKSTGPKLIDASFLLFPLFIVPKNVPNAETINVTWAFTALDANGNDVGFSCYP